MLCIHIEVCDTMNYVIDQGLAFYWATSGWTASQIMEAYSICDRLRLIRPIAEQVHYNIFMRSPLEDEYNDLIKKYKMGLVAYSPLESGILTGKYINEVPKASRANLHYDNANTLMEKYTKRKPAHRGSARWRHGWTHRGKRPGRSGWRQRARQHNSGPPENNRPW